MNIVQHINKANDSVVLSSRNPICGGVFFQPKLSINTPGDTYEQEADTMADKVMRMKDPFTPAQKNDDFFKPALAIQRKTHGTDELEDEHLNRKAIPHIQRKCAACEEEDKQIHRKENSNTTAESDADLSNYVSSLSSSGQSLPESSRHFFEPRFGQDFSNVKIHTDSVAAKSAQSINALAYTTGNNIVFNQGQYSPSSESGQKLMAHELTHVVQQGESESKIQKADDDRLDGGAPPGGAPNPPAPRGAPTTKTVSVDFVKLKGSSRSPASDLTFANTVFNPCKVQFSMGINAVAANADSDTWLGGDTTLERINSCSNAHAEENALLTGATSKFSLSSRLVVFYMDQMNPADRGLSFPPFCASGPRAPFINHAYISNIAQSRSLAHEFGHILLNSGDHPADTNNLMYPTNTSTGEQLTPTQCTTIFSNA